MRNVMNPVLKAAALVLLMPFAAHADLPGRHPAYLHALGDLRTARWFLEHRPGDAAVSGQEDVSITEIDAAIREIKHAAIDDGKDIHDHMGAQDIRDRPGRLHKALELLDTAHGEIAREEDDPATRGLRDRAVGHVDAAIRSTRHAVGDVEHGR